MVRPDRDRPREDRPGDALDRDRARGAHDDDLGGEAREGVSSARDPRTDRRTPVAGTDLICRVAVWATGVFVVVSALAAAWPDTFLPLSVPVDLVLFVAGCGAFLWAYALAIGRSRYEAVTMAGLFFLSEGVAPADVTRLLRGALGVQVVVAVVVASVRPFTALAFSVLAPMLGLGLMALWASRHGRFRAKAPEPGD